jgi:hypothetical protein
MFAQIGKASKWILLAAAVLGVIALGLYYNAGLIFLVLIFGVGLVLLLSGIIGGDSKLILGAVNWFFGAPILFCMLYFVPFFVLIVVGFVLILAGIGWVWQRIGPEGQNALKTIFGALALIVLTGSIMMAIYMFWDVSNISDRPLAALTLGDIGQSAGKLCAILFVGVAGFRLVYLLLKNADQ